MRNVTSLAVCAVVLAAWAGACSSASDDGSSGSSSGTTSGSNGTDGGADSGTLQPEGPAKTEVEGDVFGEPLPTPAAIAVYTAVEVESAQGGTSKEPSLSIAISSRSPDCANDREPSAETIVTVIVPGKPAKEGTYETSTSAVEGYARVVAQRFAERCIESEMDIAESGTVEIASVTPLQIAGSFDVVLASTGKPLRGTFVATSCGGRASSNDGLPICKD